MKTDSAPKEEPRITLTIVCAGKRMTSDHKAATQWYVVDDAERLTDESLLLNKLSGALGSVYEVEATPDRLSVYGRSLKFRHEWQGKAAHDTILEWRAVSDAVAVVAKRNKDEAKAKRADPMFEALYPIRRAYQKATNGTARRAILSQVIEHIVRHSIDDNE